jgi:TonB family protein
MPPSPCEDAQWRSVLRLAEQDNATAIRQLEEISRSKSDSPSNLLANHILTNKQETRRADVEPRLLGSLRFQPKTAAAPTTAGTVAVLVVIDRYGCVTNTSVIRRHPDDRITEEARAFVADRPFVPAMKNGIFVSGQTTVVAPIEVR